MMCDDEKRRDCLPSSLWKAIIMQWLILEEKEGRKGISCSVMPQAGGRHPSSPPLQVTEEGLPQLMTPARAGQLPQIPLSTWRKPGWRAGWCVWRVTFRAGGVSQLAN